MVREIITFDDNVKAEVLAIFNKVVNEDGLIVEASDKEQHVLTKHGNEILLKEWAGVVKGSEAFIKDDAKSLLDLAKKAD